MILIFPGFAKGNPDFCLHCFGIFYVHVQVSKYKNELIFLGCIEAEVMFLGPNKNETMLMIFFDTKHRDTDISWVRQRQS